MSPVKVTELKPVNTKSSQSVLVKKYANGKQTPSVITFIEHEPCCSCCFSISKEPSAIDGELRAMLQEGVQTRSAQQAKEKSNKKPRYQKARDGCAETGNFFVKKNFNGKTMQQLRKSCKVTKNLPQPQKAIEKSNEKQTLKGKVKKSIKYSKKRETNMTEINQLLRRRLSGTIFIHHDDAGEQGEALLKGRLMEQDITPYLLSHLVNESDLERIKASDHNLASDIRRSSFSRKSVDLTVDVNLYRTHSDKMNDQLDKTTDYEFLNRLPQISKMVKNELEKDWIFTQRYVKLLERMSKAMPTNKETHKQERWLVIFYTTSDDSDDFITFSCMLVRLILQHHCVAYEERDIALEKRPYKTELQKKMDREETVVPYVFARGVPIGGFRIIYALHKMKLMRIIFKEFIMNSDIYAEWLYNSQHIKTSLTIEVRVTQFQALNTLLGAITRVPLTKNEKAKVKEGNNIVTAARKKWFGASREIFKEPCLPLYVQLKGTINITYTILNSIYLNYTDHKRRKISSCKICLRCCC